MNAISRKAWCRDLHALPSAYVSSRDIVKLLNVCKTKAIQILKAAGGVKIAGVWRVDKADLILYLASMEKATMCSKTIAEALADALPVDVRAVALRTPSARAVQPSVPSTVATLQLTQARRTGWT